MEHSIISSWIDRNPILRLKRTGAYLRYVAKFWCPVFAYQSCVHGICDLPALLCVYLLSLAQSAPIFICEVYSELVDVAERRVEDGVPELCDVLQIRTCAFEIEHRIAVDPTVDDVTLQSDHRLPWILLPDGTLHLSSLPVSALFESPRYAGV